MTLYVLEFFRLYEGGSEFKIYSSEEQAVAACRELQGINRRRAGWRLVAAEEEDSVLESWVSLRHQSGLKIHRYLFVGGE